MCLSGDCTLFWKDIYKRVLKKGGTEPMNPVALLHPFALFLCMHIGLWLLLAKVQEDFEASSVLLDLKGEQKLLLAFGVLLLHVLCLAHLLVCSQLE